MSIKNNITHFSHEVEFTGILNKIFGKQLGNNYKAMLPSAMTNIKKIAENE